MVANYPHLCATKCHIFPCFYAQFLVIGKIITYSLMPLGIVWLVSLVAFLMSHGVKKIIWLLIFLLIGLGGNPWIGNYLLYTLEEPYRNIDPLAVADLDAVVLLGGGTGDPRLTGHN